MPRCPRPWKLRLTTTIPDILPAVLPPTKPPVNGVFLLDKPAGLSSNTALQRARNAFGRPKAGHTGTLDPLATGLLPICFGEATKYSQFLLDADKTYDATLTLGGISPTEKVIAFCRVLLATATFAIMLVDPKTPLWPTVAYPLVGAYVAVGLLFSMWASRAFEPALQFRGRLRRSALFIAGIAIPVVPTLIYLVVSGAGPYLYESWVYYPLMKYPDRFALPFPAFYPLLPEHSVMTLRDALPALLAIALVLTCVIWATSNHYYTLLLAAKYKGVYALENELGRSPIREEWEALQGKRGALKWFSLERMMPTVFILGYLAFLVLHADIVDFGALYEHARAFVEAQWERWF